jgi:hypothetical protein
LREVAEQAKNIHREVAVEQVLDDVLDGLFDGGEDSAGIGEVYPVERPEQFIETVDEPERPVRQLLPRRPWKQDPGDEADNLFDDAFDEVAAPLEQLGL